MKVRDLDIGPFHIIHTMWPLDFRRDTPISLFEDPLSTEHGIFGSPTEAVIWNTMRLYKVSEYSF